MSLKGNGLNSEIAGKIPQVEMRKIKNGDRADLVAYGPKSSIDQFQKMYQELTKQMAEESDGSESSDMEGDDESRSSSSSDHSIVFARRTAQSIANNTQQSSMKKHDPNMPPAQILIDASAFLNTKNRRK